MRYTLLGGLLSSVLMVAAPAATQTTQGPIAPEVIIRPPVHEIKEIQVVVPQVQEETPTNRRSANTTEIQCLARNVYFEARGEGQRGMRAVAHVTLNRMTSGSFRRSICGVVHQGGQFSWVGNGATPRGTLWQSSQRIAEAVYTGLDTVDPTHGATYFHATHSRPSWSRRFTRTITIGNHAFYRA